MGREKYMFQNQKNTHDNIREIRLAAGAAIRDDDRLPPSGRKWGWVGGEGEEAHVSSFDKFPKSVILTDIKGGQWVTESEIQDKVRVGGIILLNTSSSVLSIQLPALT